MPGRPDRYTILSKKIGAVKEYTMGLMSPAMVYLATGKLYRIMSRGAHVETKSIGANQVQIKATPNNGVDEKPYQCANRMGTLESLPKLFTDDFATIEHPQCYHRGDDACLYLLSWKTTQSMLWARISKYALLVTLLLTVFSALVYALTPSIDCFYGIQPADPGRLLLDAALEKQRAGADDYIPRGFSQRTTQCRQ